MDYQGWTLFDQVLIVAKRLGHWDYQQGKYIEDADWQGYVVDPSNKKMKETALNWAETCRTKYDENGKYAGYDKTPGEEFLYDNDGFILELKETAGGSSQGGKLSFWNCWITAPDGKRFKIGIAADLLLELLTQTTFNKGKCQSVLCFARRREGVGMLSRDMDSYAQALKDMQKKSDVKSKKTSKHVFGHAYTALQAANAYAGEIYVWYEPFTEKYYSGTGWSRRESERLAGFKKLSVPKHLFWFPGLPDFEVGKKYKISELSMSFWSAKAGKLPARIDSGVCVETDISLEERIEKAWRDEIESDMKYYSKYNPSTCDPIGWSSNKDTYTMPSELRNAIVAAGLRVED